MFFDIFFIYYFLFETRILGLQNFDFENLGLGLEKPSHAVHFSSSLTFLFCLPHFFFPDLTTADFAVSPVISIESAIFHLCAGLDGRFFCSYRFCFLLVFLSGRTPVITESERVTSFVFLGRTVYVPSTSNIFTFHLYCFTSESGLECNFFFFPLDTYGVTFVFFVSRVNLVSYLVFIGNPY